MSRAESFRIVGRRLVCVRPPRRRPSRFILFIPSRFILFMRRLWAMDSTESPTSTPAPTHSDPRWPNPVGMHVDD
jgi:hypothetical protein